MPNYKIEINYTSNENKAAIIKIKDDLNKTVLKEYMVLTEFLHNQEHYSFDLSINKFISTEYSAQNRYADINKISEFHQLFGSYYIGDKENISSIKIIPNTNFESGKKVIGINDEITMSEPTFNILKEILSDKYNKVTVEFNKKLFIFGQKSCVKSENQDFKSYIALAQNIEFEEKMIKAKEIKDNEDRENNKLGNRLLRLVSSIASTFQINTNQTSMKRTSRNNSNTSSSSSSNRSNNSGSLFDSFMQISQSLTISDSCSTSSSTSNHSEPSCSSPSFD